MTGQSQRETVLGDHAAFFRALLPQARGFIGHNRSGQVFWSELPAGFAPKLTTEYATLLRQLLLGRPAPDGARAQLGPYCAYLLPLTDSSGGGSGVVTVLLGDEAAQPTYAQVLEILAPACRSVQRELTLRLRVLDSQQKLQVQAAEERLLHKVESLLTGSENCEVALTTILALCREHLGVTGAFIVLPDKNLCLACGETFSESEAELLANDLLEEAGAAGSAVNAVNRRGDLLWAGIQRPDQKAQGIFALSGLEASGFSERRLARVVRYVGSHIGSLLDRHYDAVTGLLAWPLLEGEIKAAIASTDADEHTVMCCDIDQMHVINDTFGRASGDDVLRRFGDLLRSLLPGHTASRVAGDDFAILLRKTSMEQARELGERLCRAIREAVYQSGDRTHRPSVSIGVGPLVGAGEAGSGLAAAQVACRAARERGRARVEVYEPADVSIVRRMDDIQLVGYVRNAIENGRLALVAQPLMALKNSRVAHYHEVLVRIVDDDGEHVAPGDFMSAAERYHLMEDLDRWVVRSTLEILSRKGRHLRPADARFAINLSGQSLGSDSFLEFVEEAIRESGVRPGLVAFEITESLAVARMQHAQNLMHTLKKLGCRFSLDDFGTGLSSFAYLKLFPVDTLKIDGSFIRDLTTNVVSQSVVAAIAEVARVMQLETVAEYVQEQAVVDLLRKLNISYAQGYFVGRTEPLEEVLDGINAIEGEGRTQSRPTTC